MQFAGHPGTIASSTILPGAWSKVIVILLGYREGRRRRVIGGAIGIKSSVFQFQMSCRFLRTHYSLDFLGHPH
jgi:ABC-type enterobactin transport system permease subunit